jgi:hypothetical protein
MGSDQVAVNRLTGPSFVQPDEPPGALKTIDTDFRFAGRIDAHVVEGISAAQPGGTGHWEELVQRRGPFTRRALFAAALTVFSLAALSPSARANHSLQTLVSAGQINGNGDFDSTYGGVSDDGLHDFFTTQEQLVAGDTDAKYDVYERFNNTTTLVSAGQINGNGAFDANYRNSSSDGTRVYFETAEKLVSADTDNVIDVYERSGGVTTLLSQGTGNFNTTTDSFYLGDSTDGSKVFISSYDKLVATDTDSNRDIYMRSGGTTTQISTGGNGPYGADFDGMTADGARIWFHTDEQLAGTDTDSTRDVYEAFGGSVTQVSLGPTGGNGGQIPIFQGRTPDGAHVYFQTIEQLTASDTDSYLDVYDRSGGTTTEVSLGPNGGNGAYDASFQGASDTGSKVWFMTRESMLAADTDGGCEDANGDPTLKCLDLYERSGGTTTWLSTGGNGAFDASLSAASKDGSKVFFRTGETLTASDLDTDAVDVYQRSGGVTTLISTGPVGGTGPYTSDLVGISSDGARVFFHTYESLVSADNDGNWQDVYERYSGETTLISTGPAANNAAAIAFFHGQTADGSKVFFQTDEHLAITDTDSSEDIYSAVTVNPGYARPKGATPTVFSLVPAFSPCTGPNDTHGAPLSYGSCDPPTQDSAVLTIGSPDANGRSASSVSSVKFKVIAASPEDVQVVIKISDVLCIQLNAACPGGALADFDGTLLVKATVRITDRNNGSPLVEGATVQDLDLKFPIQCVATPASSTTGGSCQGTVTVNSIYPGAVLDLKRAMWQFEKIQVLDPGPNGTGFGGCPGTCGDGDETVFMRPGVYAP